MADWTCSRCRVIFTRDNEFSLLGYRQCLSCDFKMFEAKGKGEPWPEPDDPWWACCRCLNGTEIPEGGCTDCGRPLWQIDVVADGNGSCHKRYTRRESTPCS